MQYPVYPIPNFCGGTAPLKKFYEGTLSQCTLGSTTKYDSFFHCSTQMEKTIIPLHTKKIFFIASRMLYYGDIGQRTQPCHVAALPVVIWTCCRAAAHFQTHFCSITTSFRQCQLLFLFIKKVH